MADNAASMERSFAFMFVGENRLIKIEADWPVKLDEQSLLELSWRH
jgi:hypothetical protein